MKTKKIKNLRRNKKYILIKESKKSIKNNKYSINTNKKYLIIKKYIPLFSILIIIFFILFFFNII